MTELMSSVKHQIIDTPLDKDDLSLIIGKVLAKHFNADVLQADADEVDQGDMNMNACYDPGRDEDGLSCIEITLVYSPFDEFIIFDEDGFNSLTNRLADAVAHEQIHRHQYRSRDWLDTDDMPEGDDDIEIAQYYLSSKDEIDAYSHNIANELLDTLGLNQALTKLTNPRKIQLEDSVNLWVYLITFGMDIKNPVIKRLLKKVYQRLPILATTR